VTVFPSLRHPVIAAPMAGGVSTVALASAVTDAGGLGFLAAGYLPPERLAADVAAMSGRAYGVNLFVPQPAAWDRAAVERYRASLVSAYGDAVGPIVDADDDSWSDKLDIVVGAAVPVVSFTFGCPSPEVLDRLDSHGCLTVVTVTDVVEARHAVWSGAAALCVQSAAAGGHRGTFRAGRLNDDDVPLLALVTEIHAALPATPLIAAGGLMSGRGLAEVLAAGAVAGQFGTAFLRTGEAGTSPTYRAALADGDRDTVVTNAFTGRHARGLANRFAALDAPLAYPQVHHLTRPLRTAAAAAGDPEGLAMWAGTGYREAREMPAAHLVETLSAEAAA
jgi:nitronate monooxygenase